MNKYKCEKGKKQYNYCKKYDALYCSDCPHGILEENKNKKDYTLIEEKKEVIEILENVKSTYGDLDSLDELETDFILDIKEYKALLICLDLLKKQKKKIERLEKTIDENIVIEPDETGCHEELNIHIKDFIPKDTIKEKMKKLLIIVKKYNKQMENDEETDLSYDEVRKYACELEAYRKLLEGD